ncbi:response regulator [Psychrobacillus sp. NPDC093200]|uniref:response regulator n=1 Tax=Psychrobacillus sp. NPDC093200 TaxID=3390656 RepID=UPI003CFE68A1
MMKLLIVDDEPIEREGMQAILQKSFPEYSFYQAKNGKQAIELADSIRPDLVLMDIMMPGMNGLEAIEKIKETNSSTKFVMVTAFDMFDYARQAIKLGVKDYLLKPSKVTEIVSTVGKVLEECRVEKEAEASSRLANEMWQKTLTLAETDIVTQLLFDHVHEVHIDLLVEMLDTPSTQEKFVAVILLPEEAEHLYVDIKQKVRQTTNAWVGALYGRQLPIIVFRNPDKTFRAQAIAFSKEILSLNKENIGMDWFIGIGQVYGELSEIRQSYQEALIATMDPTLVVKYRFYSEVQAITVETDYQVIRQREQLYFEQLRLGDWESIRLFVLDMIQQHEKKGNALIYTQQRVLELLWIAHRVMNELGIDSEVPVFPLQALEYRQLRLETTRLLDRMQTVYKSYFERMEVDKIQQIKQFIYDNSHKDISLDILAQKVDLSPIYISKMFKEKLGINYIDFLTECRIGKAKKLLNNSERSLKEITFEIGYHDPNYFSKVFKKMCGVSPKEYRKTKLSKKVEF